MRRHVAAPLAALLLWAAGPAVPARGADSPPKPQAGKPAPARDVVAVGDGVPLKVSDLGFDLIHSVDSLDLAQEINRRAGEAGREQNVLLEVNIGREPTKAGFHPDTWCDRYQ